MLSNRRPQLRSQNHWQMRTEVKLPACHSCSLHSALNISNLFSSTGHSIASLAPPHLAYEPNPFEHSFATGATVETPGGTKLPSVAALTSPAPLLPGGGTTPYNWGSSLRTGPLSPAMLSGPTNDY